MRKIYAPFTSGQVAMLKDYQTSGIGHPYTCPNRGDGKHNLLAFEDLLNATFDGLFCSVCSYHQDWAYNHLYL